MPDEPNDKPKRLSKVRSFIGSKVSDIQSIDIGAIREEVLMKVFEPERLRGQIENASTISQIIALVILPFFILFSLPLMVVTLQLGEDALTAFDPSDPGAGGIILQFMITAGGLAIFMATAWAWFMFVRTGGFGLFELD